jgi:glycine betaine/choline ABC-type transport system substrate-binding protein
LPPRISVGTENPLRSVVGVLRVARQNFKVVDTIEVATKRTARKLELETIGDLAEAEEDLRLAAAGQIERTADAWNYLVAPSRS